MTDREFQQEISQIDKDSDQIALSRKGVQKVIRHAWESGFKLCQGYGDNQIHFRGEQKERQWAKFLETLK